jgi:hypothetical protein
MGVALDGRPSVAASEPVAKVVSGYGADERHDKHGEKLKPARPHQIASDRQHGFLGDGQSNVPENDHEEDPRVAPVRD